VIRQNDVTVLVHLRLLPDFIEQGKRDLLNFARVVRKKEPACFAIEVAQDVDDPTKIMMIEKWSDAEQYQGAHLQTQHMKSFIAQSSKYFEGAAKVSFYQGTVIGQGDLGQTPPYGR